MKRLVIAAMMVALATVAYANGDENSYDECSYDECSNECDECPIYEECQECETCRECQECEPCTEVTECAPPCPTVPACPACPDCNCPPAEVPTRELCPATPEQECDALGGTFTVKPKGVGFVIKCKVRTGTRGGGPTCTKGAFMGWANQCFEDACLAGSVQRWINGAGIGYCEE